MLMFLGWWFSPWLVILWLWLFLLFILACFFYNVLYKSFSQNPHFSFFLPAVHFIANNRKLTNTYGFISLNRISGNKQTRAGYWLNGAIKNQGLVIIYICHLWDMAIFLEVQDGCCTYFYVSGKNGRNGERQKRHACQASLF